MAQMKRRAGPSDVDEVGVDEIGHRESLDANLGHEFPQARMHVIAAGHAASSRAQNYSLGASAANPDTAIGGAAVTSHQGPTGETEGVRKQYHFSPGASGLDAWDVDRLVELSRDLPSAEVDISTISDFDTVYWFDETEMPTVRRVVEHIRLIDDVDMKYPIILGPDGKVLDGMHRIARAILEGRTTIRAVQFERLPEPDYRDCRSSELPYD